MLCNGCWRVDIDEEIYNVSFPLCDACKKILSETKMRQKK